MNASIVEKLLAGDPEAEREYRRELTSSLLALDGAFVNRLLSPDNVAKLNEAKRIGFHPDTILMHCIQFAKKTWNGHQLTPTAAKEAVSKLRRMKQDLRELLPLTELPMSDVPTRGETSSPLPLVHSTAPQFSVLGRFWLFDPTSMRTLWDVAGRDKEEGLLGDLANAIERVIPDLTAITPPHRPAHLGRREFVLRWNKLANQTAAHPYDELGAWFFEVTFDSKEYDAVAFARLRKRASLSKKS
jgi:hypothetical protein